MFMRRCRGRKRHKAQPSTAATRSATAAAPEQAALLPDRSRDGATVEAAVTQIAASLAEPEPGRKRTHEELVQLMGDDAPRALNRKKRRVELQVTIKP